MEPTDVPPDRLDVPPEDFAIMLHEAGRLYEADQRNRYAAGVFATLAWIAGLRDEDPITQQPRPATRAEQRDLLVSAGAIAMEMIPDPIHQLTGTIDPRWSHGVERTLAWVLGPNVSTGSPQQASPLPLPRP